MSRDAGESEPIRILAVDDDTDFVELVALSLEREQRRFEAITATSGEEGLLQLSSTTIDCIVSDYDMPGMNGLDFLEKVRSKYDALPFILFTGRGSEAIASDAITAGVTEYLNKASHSD